MIPESTSFILPVNVWERDSNYSTGCFHITLTYVCGIKFPSEKILDCMKKYWEISVKRHLWKSQHSQLICQKDRLVYRVVYVYCQGPSDLCSYTENSLFELDSQVRSSYNIFLPKSMHCCSGERPKGQRLWKKNLHFVLAFFSTFNHLKNVVGKAFFKKFFQDIPLLEPVLSVSRQSRLCFLTHLSRLREWWILHLILEMCEKLAERIANLDGRKLSHFLSETIDYMLHMTLQSAVTWFQKPC